MRPSRLLVRGLRYYWRTNAAVVLGVATAVAVLSGALLVGDSVRGSLRDLVLQRLGATDRLVVSTGFFREALDDELRGDPAFAASFNASCPMIAVQGMVSEAGSGRRASRVQVYGVDDRFWRFHHVAGGGGPEGRDVFLSPALAADIGATRGSAVLVRVQRPSAIPLESLHARKEDAGRTLRLTVREVLAPERLGEFSLTPQQGEVRAVFVPLKRLQQDLDLAGRVNTLLVSDRPDLPAARASALETLVRRRARLEDVGLTLRAIESRHALALESAAGLLDEGRAKAADQAGAGAAMETQPVLTYLANSLRSGDRQVPYSLVTAIDLRSIAPDAVARGFQPRDRAEQPGATPPVVLNEWAARDLHVKTGDPLTMEYFAWEESGRLLTRTADFRISAVVPIEGPAADRDLAPVYPGITDADTLGDWDPPFPIDLHRVRRVDEDYWKQYRTTPKAFIPLEVGQALWRSRFGDRTSVRVAPGPGVALSAAAEQYAGRLRETIDPIALGLSVRDVRADGLAASRGATDFAAYFTYFSFFLVASALLLAALFFRLGVEQRAREVGLLRALGFTTAGVRRLFAAEGLLLATIGSVLGMGGAVGYGWAMMAGLRTWWAGAVGTTALSLHVSPASLALGATGALLAAMTCIWWTLRGLSRLSERSLLAGSLIGEPRATRPPLIDDASELRPGSPKRQRREGGSHPHSQAAPASAGQASHQLPATSHQPPATFLAAGLGILAAALITGAFAGGIDRSAAFFGAGTSLLVACLCLVALQLKRPARRPLDGHGWWPICRLGLRNAADRPGRSVLAIGVIASATFILIAVDAFRREGPPATDRHSGVGGYPLLVDLLLPIVHDPNAREGRELLGVSARNDVSIEAFRVLPGDDASCLNLYEPQRPRVLGASQRFIAAGRFAFQGALASTGAEKANPWLLLNRDSGGDDAVPVIADGNSLTYVLHREIGDDILIDRGGRPARLRVVAALADSIFQSELLMSDANFLKLFPEQAGYRFLLVETPADRASEVAAAIDTGGADVGADAVLTTDRLAAFHTVENTYLSTFQTLGGLGLLVGTVGLAAVLLRNVLERRRELALLGATGYRRTHIIAIVVAENVLLLTWGLATGTVCALVAIAPAVAERGGGLPTLTGGLLLLVAVFGAGLVSSAVATRAALRTPLLSALRSE